MKIPSPKPTLPVTPGLRRSIYCASLPSITSESSPVAAVASAKNLRRYGVLVRDPADAPLRVVPAFSFLADEAEARRVLAAASLALYGWRFAGLTP